MSLKIRKLQSLISENGLFADGDWVESKDQDPNGEVRLIQLADIGTGEFIDKSNRFMTMEKAKLLRCTFLEPGDILIARMPDPIGRACIFPGSNMPCVTVVDVCIVRPLSSDVDSRWLMHTINSKKFNNNILNFVTGTTRQRISRGNLAKLEIPVPSLPEQKRIAAILDKADSLRRKNQQAIQLADQFLRAVFLDMFGDPVTNPKGWDESLLSQLCNGKMNNGIFKKNEEYGEGKPVAWVGELFGTHEIIFSEKTNKVTPSAKEIDKYGMNYGDILFCRSSLKLKGIGWSNVYLGKDNEALFECHVIRMPPKLDYINPVFLNFQLRLPGIRRRVFAQAKTVTMTTIDQEGLGKVKVIVPDKELQDKFEKIYRKIKGFVNKFDQQREADNLFNSLSQKAFTAEL
ncbi:MAG: restriction endonuclease subunit S [Methylicorpusculum sp.]|uniref:restriction endonuclease subunit S n=1 Tax=Methylicorpusculum sp. TaxID=2713644 RepID=UPI002723BA0D|nr:restriction endonuclease subunit S [Methylicorpusculum sp.]MDO8940928.1 restriction endonuclease subunit S [Methylicorpusculum sp.]MDP2202819.1 restriction endonuclease subunit S [Methylicorpusculum sp.]